MTTNVVGSPPWFPNLAEVMDPAPKMLDDFASEFAPIAADLSDADVYWTAFHCWVLDRLMADTFDGAVDEAWLRQAAWVTYASGFWCTRAWRGVWAPLDDSFSMETTEESVAPMAGEIRSKLPALAAGGATLRDRLGEILHTPTFHGAVYGTAYNTSYLVVVGEPAPLGQRPPHLSIEPGYVRATGDALFDVEYQAPLPAYLAASIDAYADAEATSADRLRAVLDGDASTPSLARLWKDGFELAPQNWGSDFIAQMTQPYYDPFVRWSVLYNFGLEAIARNGIVALARDDDALAAQAVAGNVIFDASWGSIQLGVIDAAAPLPEVVVV